MTASPWWNSGSNNNGHHIKNIKNSHYGAIQYHEPEEGGPSISTLAHVDDDSRAFRRVRMSSSSFASALDDSSNSHINRSSEKQEQDWNHRPSWTAALLLVVFLLALLAYFPLIQPPEKNETASTYDYIVVGGGPAGIIAATKLAKSLPHVKVLLLESGTTSQSSVLNTLQQRRQDPSQPKTMMKSTWTQSTTRGIQLQTGGFSALSTKPQATDLNKFDIPLLWSGVASSQGRLNALGSSEVWSNHHWPIRKTLLGRALGGSGLHNAMIYVRSLPTDMKLWNLTGWDYDTIILKHYQQLERYVETEWTHPYLNQFWNNNKSNISSTTNSYWRGQHGPIQTVPAGPAMDPVAPLFVQSCAAIPDIGVSSTRGFNHPNPSHRIGAGYYEFNIRNGVRDSIAQALLADDSSSRQLRNLDIRIGATVLRILSESPGHGKPRTVGVDYVDTMGVSHKVFLTDPYWGYSEIILASGAIMTPQLLYNSGIGNHGDVVDLPGVGQNLQDHPVVAMAFRLVPDLIEQSSSIYTVGDEMEDYLAAVAQLNVLETLIDEGDEHINTTIRALRQRLQEQQIRTFGTAGFSAGAFLRSPWADDEAPDLQLTVFPRSMEPHVTRKERSEERIQTTRASAMLITVALLRPDARYQVQPGQRKAMVATTSSASSENSVKADSVTSSSATRKSSSASSGTISSTIATESIIPPLEDYPLTTELNYLLPTISLPDGTNQYLSDRDVDRLVWGMERVRNITATQPLTSIIDKELYPGSSSPSSSSSSSTNLHNFVRQHQLPNSHWVGTTKMGPRYDPMAVVDEELRVHGIDNLRIVDSGTMPHVPNGNTHSMVCVVASRAAELMIEERTKREGSNTYTRRQP